LGIKNLGPMGDNASLYGVDAPEFLVTKPADGKAACFANGGTVSFAAPSRAAVHEFHVAALANGGTDEGAPGPRNFTPTAYAAYVRDPDGNKLSTYCFAPA
jgi:catechol 2,3-dioxygenase-like lactoylglutathione lyase family enzyme